MQGGGGEGTKERERELIQCLSPVSVRGSL